MKTSMKELVSAQRCLASYQLGKFNLGTEKGGTYHRAVVAKKVVKDFFDVAETDREDFIDTVLEPLVGTLMPEGAFRKLTMDLEKEELTENLKKYLLWLTQENATLAAKGTTRALKINGSNKLIEVSCDYFIEMNGQIFAISLKTGKPHLSPRGRKVDTSVGTSFELLLLRKLCDEVFPEANCEGAFHHLKERGTKELTLYGDSFISVSSVYMAVSPTVEVIEKEILNLMAEMDSGKTTCSPESCTNCRFQGICQYKKKEKSTLQILEKVKKAEDEFELTGHQRNAVLFDEGVARVNAGAGSGKTTIVILRVVEQILNGANPEDILLITFTNKGAGEIREKMKFWFDKEGLEDVADKIQIETFNSWGDQIISRHFAEMGFSAPPRLIDKVEKYDIIFNLLEDTPLMENFNNKSPLLNFPNAKGVVVTVSQIFDYLKAQGIHDLATKTPHHNVELLKLYARFNEVLQTENLMEYQDQIRLINGCIDNAEKFLDMYDYEHIIVDEFQDSDAGQMDLILHLSNQSKFKSLMIVGDDSQSIYGFRNTSQENILNFGSFFTEMTDIRLVENFRSVPEIIALANYLNSINSKRIKKNLLSTVKSNGDVPELHWFRSKDASADETKGIADSIEKDLTKGFEPEDIVVIARTKNELFEIQKRLAEKNIPSKMDVPEPLYKNPLLLPLQALLSSLDNPENTFGMAAYANILTGSILERKEEEVVGEIEEMKNEFLAIQKLDDEDGEMKRERFFSMMREVQDEELKLFLDEFEKKGFNFREIKSFVDKFVEYEDAKVYAIPSEAPVRAVKLITVHASKGKEYNVVYLTLSKFKAGTTTDENDEERRTAFVGITRARKKLFLSIAAPPSSKASHSGKPLAHEIEASNLVKVIEH